MVILTTLYNAAEYIEQCIGSIMSQSFTDFKCYITDDLSTDNSVELIENMIEGDDRFILIKNTEKHYQPGNYDQVIRNNPLIDDNEICVEIDGDDWLPNSKTLQLIHDVYQNQNVWITNGSFRYSTGGNGFSQKQVIDDNLRRARMTCSHMRTWRAFLWRNIKQEDLKDENGVYWHVTGDLAFMFPMLEMATDEHYRFIDDITYVYNGENPLNDHKVNMSSVNVVADKIRAMAKYDKLIR
jgi:glycosyltransferase involved in cell wall biosynthesis